MPRPLANIPARLVLACSLAAACWGCSDSSVPPIDAKAAIDKASGGAGGARQSAKAKEAASEAAVKHPKLQ